MKAMRIHQYGSTNSLTLVDIGKLQPSQCHSFPLSDAASVHGRGEAAGLRGRTALHIGPA